MRRRRRSMSWPSPSSSFYAELVIHFALEREIEDLGGRRGLRGVSKFRVGLVEVLDLFVGRNALRRERRSGNPVGFERDGVFDALEFRQDFAGSLLVLEKVTPRSEEHTSELQSRLHL